MARNDFHAGLAVVVITETNARSGLRLHDDLVTMFDELISSRGEKRHTMLLGFDFHGNSNDHT